MIQKRHLGRKWQLPIMGLFWGIKTSGKYPIWEACHCAIRRLSYPKEQQGVHECRSLQYRIHLWKQPSILEYPPFPLYRFNLEDCAIPGDVFFATKKHSPNFCRFIISSSHPSLLVAFFLNKVMPKAHEIHWFTCCSQGSQDRRHDLNPSNGWSFGRFLLPWYGKNNATFCPPLAHLCVF